MSERRSRWKVPLICLGVLLAAVAGPIVLVGSSAPAAAPPAVADRALVVPLPDGQETTLGELIDGTAPQPEQEDRAIEIRRQDGTTYVFRVPSRRNDLYSVGRWHAHRGNYELALECLSRIPRGHRDWSRAQRFIGLRVHARRGDPKSGIAYVHNALAADPLEGNAWQDAARVYLRTFGIDTQ